VTGVSQLPAGYLQAHERGTTIVARADVFDGVLAAIRGAPAENPTLHGFAGGLTGARPYHGREIAYGVTLPGSTTAVVVRHNRHGGALRALTGDLFLGSTRAPRELDIAIALKQLGVPTPAVLAYAIYPAGPIIARSDVVTQEIPDALDLGERLLRTEPETDERRRLWNATTRLMRRLSQAGVRHHDLNVKNVLLRPGPDDVFIGYALDVDRVEFDCSRRDAFAGNRARLRRSVEKWRRTRGAAITDREIAAFRGTTTSTR
jgi:tRNA A-37 threonylcarbamoyl transferase component Bud32